MTGRGPERENLFALGCGAFCLVALLFSAGRPWARSAMDWTARLLRWPEMPMVLLKQHFSATRSWFLERDRMVSALESLQRENRQLRLQLGQLNAQNFTGQARQRNLFLVTFRDPSAWWDEIRISLDGQPLPEAGTAMLDGSYLAGMVTSAANGAAWIRLITSTSLYIPVVVGQFRDVGVMVGDGDGTVWLKFIPQESAYPEGTELETALGSDSLPPGIPVGTLSGHRRQPVPGMVEYQVLPGADLSKLQAVSLLDREVGP